MKLMVPVFLLAATWQAVVCQNSDRFIINVEEETSIKRELNEGNFGLKINPVGETGKVTNLKTSGVRTNELQSTPEKGADNSKEAIAKISDALSGHDVSLPAAIQSHLYSPVQIYQPRLQSAPRFEISAPIPSQLAYSDTMYQLAENIHDHIQLLNQLRPTNNPFVSITPPTPTPSLLSSTPNLLPAPTLLPSPSPLPTPNYLLPYKNSQPLTSWSPQIYDHLFPSIPGVDPRNIYHEINHLQLPYDEIFRLNLDGETNDIDKDEKPSVTKNANETEIVELNKNQTAVGPNTNQNSSALSTPVAMSYVSFFQRLPNSPQDTMSGQVTLQSLSFPSRPLPPLPPLASLPPLPPSTLRPTVFPPRSFPTLPPLPSTFRPTVFPSLPPLAPSVSSSPFPSALPTGSTTPRNIGVIRIRQQSSPTPQFQSFASSTSTIFPPSTSPFPIFFKTLPPLGGLQNGEFISKPTLPPSTLRPFQPLYPFRPVPLSPNATSTLTPASFRPSLQSTSPTPLASIQPNPPSSEGIKPFPPIPKLPPLPTLRPFIPQQYPITSKPETAQIQKTQLIKNSPPISSETSNFEEEQVTLRSEDTETSPLPIIQPIEIINQKLVQTPQSQKVLQIEQPDLVSQTETASSPKQPAEPVENVPNAIKSKETTQPEKINENKQETDQKSNDKSEKPNSKTTQLPEPQDIYSQLFQNSFYPQSPGSYFPSPYLPVPVGVPPVPSFLNDGSNIVYSDPGPVVPYVPSFHNGPTAVAALQYYGSYAPHIFNPNIFPTR